MQEVFEVANRRKNLTATGTIQNATSFLGVFVSQASAVPTIKVADAGGNIINTLTPTAGQFYKCPCRVKGDLTVTISGTVDATVLYN
jgi:hypothetical protein